MQNSGSRRYRSMFWPVVMIGVGVVWLLANFSLIPAVNLNWLASLWPLLLIGIGLDMLIGRRSPVIGGLIGLLLVGGVVVLAAAGPALGVRMPSGAEVKVEQFQAPLENATSAKVTINSSSEPVEVHAAAGTDQLIDAEIGHTGEIDFRVTGAGEKQVYLGKRGTVGFSFNLMDTNRLRWDIGLTNQVPLELVVDSGSGSVVLDLDGLLLTNLVVESGSGSVRVTLPESGEAYDASVDSGSGSVAVSLPANTDVTLRLNSGSGSVSIDLPAGAAVQLDVRSSGSGSVNVPGAMSRTSGGDDRDEGVWETSGFAQAAHKITIIAEDLGSGSLNLR